MTFVLAHLSDPHLGAAHGPPLSEIFSKSGLEDMLWQFSRRRSFNMRRLDGLIDDLKNQSVDHIAVTGDVVNAGLSSEFWHAKTWLTRLAETHETSFIPGNHDTTTSRSETKMRARLARWMLGDGQSDVSFPYLKVRGPMALIGLSSAIVTAPFMATGRLGAAQLETAAALLRKARDAGLCRVILIHHPPVKIDGQRRRGLDDHAAFADLIAACGAELVLHGHQHRSSVAHLASPHGAVPIVGAPSAAADPRSGQQAAGYNLFRIARRGDNWSIDMRARRLDPAGAVCDDAALGFSTERSERPSATTQNS